MSMFDGFHVPMRTIQSALWSFLATVLIFVCAAAAEPWNGWNSPQPRVCVGFDAHHQRWGVLSVNFVSREDYCVDGYALMSHGHVSGRWYLAANRFILEGNCCPLPEGVLTNQHIFVSDHCPDNFVVTGGRVTPGQPATEFAPQIELQCTKINTTHYLLGPPSQGWFVGWGRELFPEYLSRLRGVTIQHTAWASIPAALRFGLLRKNLTNFGSGGCVGYPWGSVLTGRIGNDCENMTFRRILLRPKEEDTRPVPLQVFPACRALDNPFDPNASCLPDS